MTKDLLSTTYLEHATTVEVIELLLIQLFKTEQILAESVCLSVCLCVHRHGNVMGWLKNWHSSSSNSSTGSMDQVSAAAAAVWW